MRYTVKSLGPIRSADIEVRPLTVLVGENNTGKSWLAYSLFGLLRLMAFGPVGRTLHKGNISSESLLKVRTAASEAAERISARESSSLRFQFTREALLKGVRKPTILRLDGDQLQDVIGASVKGASVALSVGPDELQKGPAHFFFHVSANRDWVTYGASEKSPSKLALVEPLRVRAADLEKLGLWHMTMTSLVHETEDVSWRERIENLLTRFLVEVFVGARAFPAERKTLASIYDKITKDGSHLTLPLPVRDFLENILSSASEAKHSPAAADVTPQRSSDLDQKLLRLAGGQIRFDTGEPVPRLTLDVPSGPQLPIVAASSFTKSLAGLLLAFGLLKERQSPWVMVVDEPEMNAHPRAQLALIELLASLANRGHYVIVTTHSPYIIDHLNNLLIASSLKPALKASAAHKFVLEDPDCFLQPHHLGAWEVGKDGRLKDLARGDGTISGSSLGKASTLIENLHADLIELREK